jgi:hypothetical protein
MGVTHRFRRRNIDYDEYGNLTCHQEPSSNSESSKDEEEEEPENGMWQARSNRIARAGVLLTYATAEATTPNTTCNSTSLEFLQSFLTNFLLMIPVQESDGCTH